MRRGGGSCDTVWSWEWKIDTEPPLHLLERGNGGEVAATDQLFAFR
jgi:hypothetical protein